jgi:hypothetical protein
MSVMKNCKYRGCRTSPRCRHDWFFDMEYRNSRYSMKVNEYAALRGATHPVTSKQEAREVWEPLYRLDIIAGRDPRASLASALDKPSTEGMTIADFIDQWYIPLYVNVEPLRAARAVRSNCAVLRRLIGQHHLKALEGKDPVDVVKRAYSGHALSTRNRMLSRVRHMTNWARGRDSLGVKTSPFHRDGIRISVKQEVQRDRRMSEVEERALLDACVKLDEPSFHSTLTWEDVNAIRARAVRGEAQVSIASDYGTSSGLCSQIVCNRIWNPDAYAPLPAVRKCKIASLARSKLAVDKARCRRSKPVASTGAVTRSKSPRPTRKLASRGAFPSTRTDGSLRSWADGDSSEVREASSSVTPEDRRSATLIDCGAKRSSLPTVRNPSTSSVEDT